mmetsp:Transcript_25464/g.39441  ORF Transcript_25464/g.39441 Transcript_25464/m.39441 type:complete len:216 (-) Transcript_25464:494-1141(-)
MQEREKVQRLAMPHRTCQRNQMQTLLLTFRMRYSRTNSLDDFFTGGSIVQIKYFPPFFFFFIINILNQMHADKVHGIHITVTHGLLHGTHRFHLVRIHDVSIPRPQQMSHVEPPLTRIRLLIVLHGSMDVFIDEGMVAEADQGIWVIVQHCCVFHVLSCLLFELCDLIFQKWHIIFICCVFFMFWGIFGCSTGLFGNGFDHRDTCGLIVGGSITL